MRQSRLIGIAVDQFFEIKFKILYIFDRVFPLINSKIPYAS